jgi:hypothetical protein
MNFYINIQFNGNKGIKTMGYVQNRISYQLKQIALSKQEGILLNRLSNKHE